MTQTEARPATGSSRLAASFEILLVAVFAALPPVLTVARVSPPLFLGLAVAGLAGLAFTLRGRQMFDGLGRRLRSPLFLCGLACIAFMFLSLEWTPELVRKRGFSSASGALVCVLAMALLWLSVDALPEAVAGRLARRIGIALAAALPLTGVLIFIQFHTAGALNTAVGADPENYIFNRAAVAIAMLLPFAALTGARGRWRRLSLAGLVFAGVSTFQTESSSAQLGMLLIVLLLVPALMHPRTTCRVVCLGSLLTFLIMPLIVGHVNSMIPQKIHDMVGYSSLTLRGLIWTEYAELMPNRILLGYGVEASNVSDQLPDVADYPQERKKLLGYGHSHNAAIQIWFELGAVGVALFTIASLAAFRRISRLQGRTMTAATLTLAVIYGVSTVSHGAWQGWWLSIIVLSALPFLLHARSSAVAQARS